MSVTCGFFNAVNHDRLYDAEQMSSLFNGIINDGVFMNIGSGMAVKANPGDDDLENMNIYIETGRCWFDGTWTHNDAIEPLTIEDAEVVLDRIDTVCLEVNHDDSVRACQFKIIKGTPATYPTAPVMEDSEYIHQHRFADVYVAAGVTVINQENITDFVGTSETPYITGILETINADDLLAQWQDEFLIWKKQRTISFDEWFQTIMGILDEEAATHLQLEIDDINNKYKILSGTLSAGETSITFTDSLIGEDLNTMCEIITSTFYTYEVDGINLVLTFEAQEEDIDVVVRLTKY